MSTETEKTFSMEEFLEKDMEENREVYEAFSTDLEDADVGREDYGY